MWLANPSDRYLKHLAQALQGHHSDTSADKAWTSAS